MSLKILWASKEHSTYASTQFIEVIKRKFNFKIECIQTDNGFDFTNRFNRHMKMKLLGWKSPKEKYLEFVAV